MEELDDTAVLDEAAQQFLVLRLILLLFDLGCVLWGIGDYVEGIFYFKDILRTRWIR